MITKEEQVEVVKQSMNIILDLMDRYSLARSRFEAVIFLAPIAFSRGSLLSLVLNKAQRAICPCFCTAGSETSSTLWKIIGPIAKQAVRCSENGIFSILGT